MQKRIALLLVCLVVGGSTANLRQVHSQGSLPNFKGAVTVAIGLHKSLIDISQRKEETDMDANMYESQQKEWEKEQEQKKLQSEVEKKMEEEKLAIEQQQETQILKSQNYESFNDDINTDADVNAPNMFLFTGSSAFSIVKPVQAAPIEEIEAEHEQVQSLTPLEVGTNLNMMPIEKLTIEDNETSNSINFDDALFYAELLGTYEPSQPQAKDPQQLNQDTSYTVEEQVIKPLNEEEAKSFFKLYSAEEEKIVSELLHEQKIENTVVSVPTIEMAPKSIVPQEQYATPAVDANPILPFSHPEFDPSVYVYPESEVPEVPHLDITGDDYHPEETGQKPAQLVVVGDETQVINEEQGNPVLLMFIQKSLNELLDNDRLFNAGPDEFQQ